MNKISAGWINGFIGVVIFAGSLPATRVAVMDFDPVFLTAVRATIPAFIGAIVLIALKQRIPTKQHLASLIVTALGVVVGFPLLSALALQHITSAHAIVFLGILPLLTAIFAVLRGDKRPPMVFWIFALLGSACIASFAALSKGHSSLLGGIFMLGAVVTCALGYAEGARLTKVFGGWQVISWALIISLPIMLPLALYTRPDGVANVTLSGWIGLAYISLFSMFIGFIFWYRGLAQGGIAAVGQLQLLQPFMGLMLASILLHETVSVSMIVSTVGAIICVAGAKRYAA
ncbi:DMT family transporter [Psychrobacter raelei]|uniref:DMT family transporter n=1 Tax=Psychrobacter raelei TaxID=2565531 RepID=UPI003F61ED81